MSNSRKLDQFYTDPKIAKECLVTLQTFFDMNNYDVVLEPSAGEGAFFNILPMTREGLDIEPKSPGIKRQDFLEYVFDPEKTYLTLGNPPFGKNGSLALKFFNKSSEYSKVVAFILPRTFRKRSMINRLHTNMHLVHETILPNDSFIFEGKSYDVPCVFQIWEKRDFIREKIKVQTTHSDFTEVSKDSADIAIQRVGGRAGLIRTANFGTYSSASHYFLQLNDANALQILQQIDFTSVKFDTAGNPSISRSELIELYEQAKNIAT